MRAKVIKLFRFRHLCCTALQSFHLIFSWLEVKTGVSMSQSLKTLILGFNC